MYVCKVTFEQNKNLGNYQSARYGVEVLVAEGESPAAAMDRAKAFVQHYLNGNIKPVDPDADKRAQAKKIVAAAENAFADEAINFDEVEAARQWLAEHPEPTFDF